MMRRWRALVSEFGSGGIACLYVLHRLLVSVSGGRAAIVPYAIVAQPVGNAALSVIRDDPHTEVRRIEPDDPLTACFPRPQAVIARRFAEGSTCYVALVKGQFAGYLWIARVRYEEDEVRCVYALSDPALVVWDYDVYVEPRFRLGRTLMRMWRFVDGDLRQQGVQWTMSRISKFNPSSLAAHGRLGAKRTASAVFVVLGRWQLAWFSGQPRLTVLSPQQSGPRLPVGPASSPIGGS